MIELHGDDLKSICGKDLHPHHKYLECLLQDYSSKMNNKLYGDATGRVREEINKFVKTYEEKVDKTYVLFLFKFYGYHEGLKAFSHQMNLN